MLIARMKTSYVIYDPALDPDRSCAARLVKLLEALSRASEDVQ